MGWLVFFKFFLKIGFFFFRFGFLFFFTFLNFNAFINIKIINKKFFPWDFFFGVGYVLGLGCFFFFVLLALGGGGWVC
ncbi:hypothetical protein, partial [Pectobacterium brasiliense]|uniref:hypothetical protein n=1 Tax=Pectobacterium brasiliense TaxID=180957 RepID=UPI0019693CAE